MQELFEQKKATEGVYIYKGIEGNKNVLRDILNVGETFYTIAGKGIWANPPSFPLSESFVKEAKRKKIKCYILFDETYKKEVIENIKATGQTDIITYRFLPEKYSSMAAVDIYKDRVAIWTGGTLTPLDENVTIFMMISQKLADSYRQWFQFMWDRCSPK